MAYEVISHKVELRAEPNLIDPIVETFVTALYSEIRAAVPVDRYGLRCRPASVIEFQRLSHDNFQQYANRRKWQLFRSKAEGIDGPRCTPWKSKGCLRSGSSRAQALPAKLRFVNTANLS
jgi:hypothetical protein